MYLVLGVRCARKSCILEHQPNTSSCHRRKERIQAQPLLTAALPVQNHARAQVGVRVELRGIMHSI